MCRTVGTGAAARYRSAVPEPSIAVIVVSANSCAEIERCLEALQHQTLRPRRVLVVDNASTDGSPEAIASRFPAVELLRLEQNVGFAAANNVGVRSAGDCEFVAFLNPDAFAEPLWLEALARAADANPDYSLFASRMIKAREPEVLDGTGDVYHVSGMAWRRDEGEPVAEDRRPQEEIFSPCAAAALYRRDVFLDAGGFDESFFCYYEDIDLAFRLRLRGARSLYVPESVVRHVGFASAGKVSDFTIYHSHRNSVWTYAKNMPAPLVWLYLPQHLLANILNIATAALHGHGRAGFAAKRDALRGLPRVLDQRRILQRERTAPVRQLRRAMSQGFHTYLREAWRARNRLGNLPSQSDGAPD